MAPKVVALVTVLARHGYLTPEKIEKAVGRTVASTELEKAHDIARQWKKRAEDLDKTLEKERGYAEMEVDRLEKELEETQERERSARLNLDQERDRFQEKLSEVEAERDRLATSAKKYIASLRGLEGELEEAILVDDTLSDVYENLKEKTDAFEESVTGPLSD